MKMLVCARALAGLGASGIFGLVDIIVADVTTIRNRGLVYSFMTMVWILSSICGPIIGGLLVDHVSWRWIFYINLPLGLIIFPLVTYFLRLPSPTRGSLLVSLKTIDWIGSLILALVICSLLLAIQGGGVQFDWNSPYFISLIAVSLVLAGTFIFVEKWVSNPVLPLSIFKNRNSVGTFVCAFFIGASLLQNIYVPELFQVMFNDSPTISGVKIISLAIGTLVSQFVCGAITSKTGIIFPFVPIGAIFITMSCLLLGFLNQNSALWQQILCLFIAGISPGMVVNSNLVIAQEQLDGDELATTISTLNLFQVLGNAIAPAIAAAVFNDKLSTALKNGVNIGILPDQLLTRLLSDPSVARNETLINSGSPLQKVVLEGYSNALSTVFFMSVAFGVGLLISSAFLNKTRLPKKEAEEVELEV